MEVLDPQTRIRKVLSRRWRCHPGLCSLVSVKLLKLETQQAQCLSSVWLLRVTSVEGQGQWLPFIMTDDNLSGVERVNGSHFKHPSLPSSLSLPPFSISIISLSLYAPLSASTFWLIQYLTAVYRWAFLCLPAFHTLRENFTTHSFCYVVYVCQQHISVI